MRLAIKIILFVVIIAIAGVVSLPFVVNPNDYKKEIATQVEKATGRKLTIQGDIHLSVFPWIALKLGPLSLSNAPGFSGDNFAKVDAAQIRIKLLPLLHKKLEMDTVVLDGLVLNLETNKHGKTNWADLAGGRKTTPPPTQPSQQKSGSKAPPLAAISIAGVKLTNANILWSDAAKGEHFQLRNLNLNTDPLEPGKPTTVAMNFDLISAKPEAKAHTNLSAKVTVDMAKQQYKVDNLKFSTVAQAKALPIQKANVELSGNINADMVKQLVFISDLKLNAKASKDKQKIDARLSSQVQANLASQQTTLSGVNLTAKVTDPAIPGKEANIKLTSNISSDMKRQTLTVSDLVLQLQDLLVKGNIKAGKLLSGKPDYAGKLNVEPFDLRKLVSNMGIELPPMADDSTLKNVALSTDFAGTTNNIDLKKLHLTLDQSKLTGQVAINHFAKPAFNFKLNLDQIDADRYLPPVEKNKKAATAAPAPATNASTNELPINALRQINAKGTIDIGKLKVSGVNSQNIHVELNATGGLVKLTPMSADLYKGHYQGNVIMDARSKTLKVGIDEHLKGVQAGPLLKDLSGDNKISGTANTNVKLHGSGNTVPAIQKTLTGNGNFAFTNGALKGINIAESIRKAKAALKGQSLPTSSAPEQTDFSSLTGSFTAKNGLIHNQDLKVMSPLLRINGAGNADLPTQKIDYELKVSVVGSTEGQGGKALSDLKGVTIPVKITGTFNKPKPTVDLASILKSKAKEEIRKKATEQLKNKLGSDLGGLLGNKPAPSKNTSGSNSTTPQKQDTTKTPQDLLKEKLKSLF